MGLALRIIGFILALISLVLGVISIIHGGPKTAAFLLLLFAYSLNKIGRTLMKNEKKK